ncbi:MotA/TolQ/ExbB proton channel family protein [Pseudenhygromyxa sp. WMMC2535]|uniref:MotA/TolQ/ExbB proton channel family protein n=1 Tax=Pseudenhygromyxa sp. WMMC2535 TaxID=2712867 RepID=UPI0015528BC4|nr:MotA/TolQ/ExbB proton channel family protein [Pseudenhygromyxa sp. WMMC2535]NVB41860.1 MotA/TolQ/ExbB proton channel family protein [Pseudenhygromyxa sp. WMMC2535]
METLLLLAEEAPTFTLSGMWAQMGIFAKLVLIFLLVQFVITSIMAVERGVVFAIAKRQSINYIMLLRNFLNERKLDDSVAAVKQHHYSPIAKVVGSGMDEYLQGLEALQEEGPDDVGDFDLVDAVNRQMERSKERETANLKRGLALIATTGSTAPFVGLLGTVVGIINSFQGLSSDGGGGLSSVAGGISEALVATAVGLLVAIPAVMAFNYFNARVEGFQIDMNDVASEVINYVLKEGRY